MNRDHHFETYPEWDWGWFKRFWRVSFFRRDVFLDGGSRSYVIGPLTIYRMIYWH